MRLVDEDVSALGCAKLPRGTSFEARKKFFSKAANLALTTIPTRKVAMTHTLPTRPGWTITRALSRVNRASSHILRPPGSLRTLMRRTMTPVLLP